MRYIRLIFPLMVGILFTLIFASHGFAQETQPPASPPELTVSTTYPGVEVGIGESVSLPIKLHITDQPDTVSLTMKEIPEGWTATFRGGGRTINSVYVDPSNDVSVDLKLDPPADVAAGTYNFTIAANGTKVKAELKVVLTIREKQPPRLSLESDLPTVRGTPTTTFRFNVTLRNEGDEDLTVDLLADAPQSFLVTFSLAGQDVTNIPIGANETKSLSIQAKPVSQLEAGNYPIQIHARSGDINADLTLTAEVAGAPDLSITGPDGRLSDQIYSGKETSLKLVVSNDGSASARGVELSSSAPSGWTINFEPKQIPEIPPGQQVEVTAKVRPADKAIAGDYVVTFRAQPAEGTAASNQYRLTVLTSTLWGMVGIGLIAVAVIVVGVAVARFGRR